MANIPLDNRLYGTTNSEALPYTVRPVAKATVAPQMPPPPAIRVTGGSAPVAQILETPSIQPPPPVTAAARVAGGTAPVGSLNPNEVVYNSDGSIAYVGAKPSVNPGSVIETPSVQPPPPPGVIPTAGGQVTGGAGQVTTAPPAITPVPPYQLPSLDGSDYVATATGNPAGQPESAGQLVQDNLNNLLSSDSAYIQNARLRGIEQAQSRGLRNSSISAGASERSAIEAAQPILSEIQSLTRQRESLAFQGEQSQLERTQQVNNAMLGFEFQRTLQGNAALQQDWLSSNAYTREFNGNLAQMPIANAAALSQMIAQYALENPEVYTPETISGMQNFFTGSLAAILQQYFPSIYGTPQTAGAS